MKHATFIKAQRTISYIENLKTMEEEPHRFCLTLVDNIDSFEHLINAYYRLPERLQAKLEQWKKEFKTLIREEIAALEKEFAELSDDTITEEK